MTEISEIMSDLLAHSPFPTVTRLPLRSLGEFRRVFLREGPEATSLLVLCILYEKSRSP